MKAGSHPMPELRPEASTAIQLVQIEVPLTHPLLLLKRALPSEVLTEQVVASLGLTGHIEQLCASFKPTPTFCLHVDVLPSMHVVASTYAAPLPIKGSGTTWV